MNFVVAEYIVNPWAQQVVQRVTEPHLIWRPPYDPGRLMIWEAVTAILEREQECRAIPERLLQANLPQVENFQGRYGNPLARQQIAAVWAMAFTAGQDATADSTFREYFQFLIDERLVEVKGLAESAGKSAREQVEVYHSLMQSHRVSGTAQTGRISLSMLGSLRSERIPFAPPMDLEPGVAFHPGARAAMAELDAILGGGMLRSDSALFIVPTSGGKTMIGLQMAWCRALQKQHALYLTYEQSEDDLRPRLACLAADADMESLEEPAARARLQAAEQHYNPYLSFYDLSAGDGGDGGLAEIEQLFGQATREGRRPSLIVVDWLQTAVERDMARRNVRPSDLTNCLNRFASDFAAFCRREQVQGVLLQQADTRNQNRVHGRGGTTDSANSKALANYMRVVFNINRADPDSDLATLSASKITAPGPGATSSRERVFHLDGPRACFTYDSRMIESDHMDYGGMGGPCLPPPPVPGEDC